MKKLLVFIILGLVIGCQDVVDLETPTGPTRLNVDAHFRVFSAEEPLRTTGQVTLTQTVNFFDEVIPPVSGAMVSIQERGTSNVYILQETQPGTGIYEHPDLSFLLDFDAVFDLTIETEGEVYTASAQLIPTAPIIDLRQGDLEIFGEEDVEVRVRISDTGGVDNFYLFDFGFELYAPVEDTFFDGNEFEFSYLYTEEDGELLEPGERITVINDGIDAQFYRYMELLLDQVEPQGPFTAPPATLRGNIINQQDPDNFAYGYFRISESVSRELVIEE